MNPDLERAAELVAGGGVVAFTGAGISAESGIPTFRDPGGLWDRYDPMRFGTFDGIARDVVVAAGEGRSRQRQHGGQRPVILTGSGFATQTDMRQSRTS